MMKILTKDAWKGFGWKEILTLAALIWLLRPAPSLLAKRYRMIREDAPVLLELSDRIPPSRAEELKGTYPMIQRINRYIPRYKNLLYVGEMRYGIRLRYYTLPRCGLWYYVFDRGDWKALPEYLSTNRVDWVLLQHKDSLAKGGIPESWSLVYENKKSPFKLYRVKHDR